MDDGVRPRDCRGWLWTGVDGARRICARVNGACWLTARLSRQHPGAMPCSHCVRPVHSSIVRVLNVTLLQDSSRAGSERRVRLKAAALRSDDGPLKALASVRRSADIANLAWALAVVTLSPLSACSRHRSSPHRRASASRYFHARADERRSSCSPASITRQYGGSTTSIYEYAGRDGVDSPLPSRQHAVASGPWRGRAAPRPSGRSGRHPRRLARAFFAPPGNRWPLRFGPPSTSP